MKSSVAGQPVTRRTGCPGFPGVASVPPTVEEPAAGAVTGSPAPRGAPGAVVAVAVGGVAEDPHQHALPCDAAEVLARVGAVAVPRATRHALGARGSHDLVPAAVVTVAQRHHVIAARAGLHDDWRWHRREMEMESRARDAGAHTVAVVSLRADGPEASGRALAHGVRDGRETHGVPRGRDAPHDGVVTRGVATDLRRRFC